jgi:hypothetical protein
MPGELVYWKLPLLCSLIYSEEEGIRTCDVTSLGCFSVAVTPRRSELNFLFQEIITLLSEQPHLCPFPICWKTGVPEIWKFTNTSLWAGRTEQSAREQARTGGQCADLDSGAWVCWTTSPSPARLTDPTAGCWGPRALCWAEQQMQPLCCTWLMEPEAFADMGRFSL